MCCTAVVDPEALLPPEFAPWALYERVLTGANGPSGVGMSSSDGMGKSNAIPSDPEFAGITGGDTRGVEGSSGSCELQEGANGDLSLSS